MTNIAMMANNPRLSFYVMFLFYSARFYCSINNSLYFLPIVNLNTLAVLCILVFYQRLRSHIRKEYIYLLLYEKKHGKGILVLTFFVT